MSLFLLAGAFMAVMHLGQGTRDGNLSPTLILGFLLLGAYCVGFLTWRLGFPWITGYIIAGLLMGPHVFGWIPLNALNDLRFLNSLALAFIAFSAGGELRLNCIRDRFKSILFLTTGVALVVFLGVSMTIYFLTPHLLFSQGWNPATRLLVSAIFGVIAVARSPSSTIAIICETRAKGSYTDTSLSVTVATDVLIIMLFAVVVSIGETALFQGKALRFGFFFQLLLEIGSAFLLGFLLAKAIVFLIRNLKVEFPVVIAGMGFLVIKFSHLLGEYLQEAYRIGLDLEPLLICMAAGFTVQNFSKHGEQFLAEMESVSLPIYVSFFAFTGATIDLKTLESAWLLGLVLVVSRAILMFVGANVSGRLAGDDRRIYANVWMAFITQAGVSLGLLTEVVRRFPEFGLEIQSILISAITINQVIGPVLFKMGLKRVGEIPKM